MINTTSSNLNHREKHGLLNAQLNEVFKKLQKTFQSFSGKNSLDLVIDGWIYVCKIGYGGHAHSASYIYLEDAHDTISMRFYAGSGMNITVDIENKESKEVVKLYQNFPEYGENYQDNPRGWMSFDKVMNFVGVLEKSILEYNDKLYFTRYQLIKLFDEQ